MHNFNVVVKQDDVAVGLFLTLFVGEVYMLAHHLVVVAAVQLLMLSILHVALVVVVVVVFVLDDERYAWLKLFDGDGRA